LLQQELSLPSVLGPDEAFKEIVQVALDALSQYKTMVTGEFAGVTARPQDQLVNFRDNNQLLIFRHLRSWLGVPWCKTHIYCYKYLKFALIQQSRGKAVKQFSGKSSPDASRHGGSRGTSARA
jgi:hypothetical protein